MSLEEIIVAIMACLWAGLFFVERAARKSSRLGEYAWLARAIRPLILCCMFAHFYLLSSGAFIGIYRPWNWALGIAVICLGLLLSVRVFLRRRQVQNGFQSGRINAEGGD